MNTLIKNELKQLIIEVINLIKALSLQHCELMNIIIKALDDLNNRYKKYKK